MKIIGWLAMVAALSGCAIAPGIRMTGEPGVDIVTIDAELLLQQRQERDARASASRALARPELAYTYRVGPGDVLNVVVWGHPELSNPMGQTENIEQQARLVREDGTMFFPFVGVINVEGKTVEDIREMLARGLRPFVTDPQVDVRVIAFRSKKVYVTGEVTDPGIVPLTDYPLSALDAISEAGGFTANADRRHATLTRGDEEVSVDTRILYSSGHGDMLLHDGDVLHVPDNEYNRVFVMGEVSQQTAVSIEQGRLSLAEALTDAQGIALDTADTRNVFVLRARYTPDGIEPEVYHLDASSAIALVLAEGFELQPRDIIYVASTSVVRFNRVMRQILPSVQTVWQADRIIRD